MKAAAREIPHPDMVIMLGDAMAHHLKYFSHRAFANVTSRVAAAFPGVGCVSVLGNSDVFPDYNINLTNPDQFTGQGASVSAACGLSPDAAASLRDGGFYAYGGWRNGPRVLVLNTGPYSTMPKAPPLNESQHPDPYGQFAWLERELRAARAQRERVLVLGHAPPCLDYYDRQPLWQEA